MARTRKIQPEPGLEPQPEAIQPEPGLVAVGLGGEVMHVHPTCLKAHQDLGWKVLE